MTSATGEVAPGSGEALGWSGSARHESLPPAGPDPHDVEHQPHPYVNNPPVPYTLVPALCSRTDSRIAPVANKWAKVWLVSRWVCPLEGMRPIPLFGEVLSPNGGIRSPNQ